MRLWSRFTSALVATLRAVTYTPITPSTVANGDQFPAATYNTIVADISDHESRITTNANDIAALNNKTTGTFSLTSGQTVDIAFPSGYNFINLHIGFYENASGIGVYPTLQFLNGSTPYSSALYDYATTGSSNTNQTSAPIGARAYASAGPYVSTEDFVFDIRSDANHYPHWDSNAVRWVPATVTTGYSHAQYRSTSAVITGVRFSWGGTYTCIGEYIVHGVS